MPVLPLMSLGLIIAKIFKISDILYFGVFKIQSQSDHDHTNENDDQENKENINRHSRICYCNCNGIIKHIIER